MDLEKQGQSSRTSYASQSRSSLAYPTGSTAQLSQTSTLTDKQAVDNPLGREGDLPVRSENLEDDEICDADRGLATGVDPSAGNIEAQEEKEHPGHHHPPVHFPDGGWEAWLVVLGGCHCIFATFGFLNSWGIFQQYYQDTLFPEQTSSAIAWIGSLQYLLFYFPGLFMGRLLDTGHTHWPIRIACVVYPVSLILTAEVKAYWQCVLCQGLLTGVSGGILFSPTIPIMGHWFHRKRALAIGIAASAGSVGGVIFPVLVHNIIEPLGFKWSMRICAFIILYCTAFLAFTMKPRLPPRHVSGGLVNPRAFLSAPYALFSISALLVALGLYTPLSYIDVSGASIGLGDFSPYLVAIANAGSLAGRLLPAFVADKMGPVNLLVPGLFGSMATTFAWPYASTKSSLIGIAVTNGCFQGMYVSLLGPSVAQLGDTADLGRRIGMIISITGIGCLIGPPISGALLASGGLKAVSYFAGVTVLVGAFSMVASRRARLGQWRGVM